MEKVEKKDSTDLLFNQYTNQLSELRKGDNVLVIHGEEKQKISLIKFESFSAEEEEWNVFRMGRGLTIPSFGFGSDEKSDRRKKHKLNILGTHRIDFALDKEFGVFFPSSMQSDLFLTLARETGEGEVEKIEKNLTICTSPIMILKRLSDVLEPFFMKNVVHQFLDGAPTCFKIPGKKFFSLSGRFTWQRKLYEFLEGLEHGDFVYVGSKREVYLLSVAKFGDKPYMQGTYTTSAKPILYISNNYLNFISKYDARKPKFKGEGSVNVAKYRTYDIPSFEGEPFIFPQVGRSQDCKNSILTGQPEVMTNDIVEALTHFRQTDFSELEGLVSKYYERRGIIHPSSPEPNGRFYY
jgi:hypothetical protein